MKSYHNVFNNICTDSESAPVDLFPIYIHVIHCNSHCIIHYTMPEINEILHCTVYYTVQNALHFVLWKQVYCVLCGGASFWLESGSLFKVLFTVSDCTKKLLPIQQSSPLLFVYLYSFGRMIVPTLGGIYPFVISTTLWIIF